MNMTTKERPILFSVPMVRAILDGRKTQTRRVVKPQLEGRWNCWLREGERGTEIHVCRREHERGEDCEPEFFARCPYGSSGDRLWVREAHWIHESERIVAYRADGEMPKHMEGSRWRPSIHMPRWASRLLLEVTEVRVERLQEITEEGAIAEGVTASESVDHSTEGVRLGDGWILGPTTEWHSASGNFALLWDSFNDKRGHGWDENPWVWVVSFRRLQSQGRDG